MIPQHITEIDNPITFQAAITNLPLIHNTQSPKLPVKQTNKLKQMNLIPNACAQEALQTPALAQVWVVWSK